MPETYGQELISEQWIGIPSDPYSLKDRGSSDQYIGWIWKTHSGNPCAVCLYMDENYFPWLPPKPHPGCACTRTVTFWPVDFLGRQKAGEEQWEKREPYKEIPPNGSLEITETDSIDYTIDGGITVGNDTVGITGGGSRSYGESRSEAMNIGNPSEEPVWAYHVTTHIREYFIDYYASGSRFNRKYFNVQGYRERVFYRTLDYGENPDKNYEESAPPPPKTFENMDDGDGGFFDWDLLPPKDYP